MLAGFDLPADRNPKDLWRHDAELVEKWGRGEAPDCIVHVAEDDNSTIAGFAITSMRAEILSGDPSAHLEALAVNPDFRRQGIGERLIEATEKTAIERGAESLTLHVFGLNERARRLYGRVGFDEELIRCRKPLGSNLP